MSSWAQGPGWWQASDGRWYPPESHPNILRPPPPHGADPHGHRSYPGRRRTVWLSILGTLIVLVLIAVLVVLLVSIGGPSKTDATFVPVSTSASSQQLGDDASELSRRLQTLGVQSDSVSVQGRTVVVRGDTRLPGPRVDLDRIGHAPVPPGTLSGSAVHPARNKDNARSCSGRLLVPSVFTDRPDLDRERGDGQLQHRFHPL